MPPARLVPVALALLVAGVLAGLPAGPARAQAPLYLVNDSTTVAGLRFRFVETQTLEPAQLQMQIATKAPGFFESGWREAVFGWLPFFGGGGVYPFSPVELQKDVVRLERYYHRNGFPRPTVDYLVRLDSTANDVAILFNVTEGPPLLIDSLIFAGPGGLPATEQLEPGLQDGWASFQERIALQQGERLTDIRLIQLQDQTLGWLRERGYAFADVSAESRVDSAALRADVRIKMTAGPVARYGPIVVQGVESVSERVVQRELPFRTGEPFRQSELQEGQRQIFSLDLFQLAAVDIADTLSLRDQGVVGIRVLVRETDPRAITGFTGYSSAGGLTGSAQWTHRNFFGGARAFTASLLGQTGLGAVGQDPQIEYEARLSLRQPYFFHRHLSASAEPFARYQDDVIERATEYGLTGNLLYERGPLQAVTLSPTFSSRTVGADSVSLVDPSTLLAGSAFSITRLLLRLTGALGRVDDPLNPRRGVIVRPTATVSGFVLSDVEYGALSVTAAGFLPFGEQAGLVARVTGGALLPFGGTTTAAPFDYLALRDALFFAGGTTDVRGWPSNLLGPKFIDFVSVDTTVVFEEIEADGVEDPVREYYRGRYGVRYRPVGGGGKVSASVQVNLPLPLGPQWGASVFADAGRVFAPAEGLYTLFENTPVDSLSVPAPDLPLLVEQFRRDSPALRYGVGAGLQYLTPVGYLAFALGVKLNPSYFDLRDPVEVFRAADIEDREPGPPDFDLAPARWSKRLQFHLSIGQRF